MNARRIESSRLLRAGGREPLTRATQDSDEGPTPTAHAWAAALGVSCRLV